MHYFASIILAQSGDALSSETDSLETHSFLLSSFIHSSRGEQYVGWRINYKIYAMCRSSRSQLFFKIGALKNLAIFTQKHLCWSLFLIKLQAWRCYYCSFLIKTNDMIFHLHSLFHCVTWERIHKPMGLKTGAVLKSRKWLMSKIIYALADGLACAK